VIVRQMPGLGLTASLNRGLEQSRGRYVARHDAGDLSDCRRLAEQVACLDRWPDVGLVGSAYVRIDARGRFLHVVEVLQRNDEIKLKLRTKGNCFAHGSVMFRADCVREAGGYRPQFRLAQDYDLWLRVAERREVANLADPLYRWRVDPSALSIRQLDVQRRYATLARELADERLSTGQDRLQRGLPAGVEEQGGGAVTAFSRLRLGENYAEWADEFFRRGNYGMAARFLARALRQDPSRRSAWGQLLQCAARGLLPAPLLRQVRRLRGSDRSCRT
jgi:hypothetical protein